MYLNWTSLKIETFHLIKLTFQEGVIRFYQLSFIGFAKYTRFVRIFICFDPSLPSQMQMDYIFVTLFDPYIRSVLVIVCFY